MSICWYCIAKKNVSYFFVWIFIEMASNFKVWKYQKISYSWHKNNLNKINWQIHFVGTAEAKGTTATQWPKQWTLANAKERANKKLKGKKKEFLFQESAHTTGASVFVWVPRLSVCLKSTLYGLIHLVTLCNTHSHAHHVYSFSYVCFTHVMRRATLPRACQC